MPGTLEARGRVVDVRGDVAEVRIAGASSCHGCRARAVCGSGAERSVRITAPANAVVGDPVVIKLEQTCLLYTSTGWVAMRGPGSAIAARARPCSISPISSSGTTMTSLSIDRSTGPAARATQRRGRRLALAWSATSEAPGMLRVAFASNDRSTVNQHFGAAEGFAVYSLDGERARLVEIVEFPPAAMEDNEGRLPARVASLAGCAAVYLSLILI